MSDLRGFSVRFDKFGSAIPADTDKLVRNVALAVDATVVMATPVDTGRARSNWIVELGEPASGTIEPLAEGNAAARASIEAAKKVIATYKGGVDIHLTNNLSYISALNDGTSAQAPAGFVQTAIHDGVAQIRGAPILVKAGGVIRLYNGGKYGE